MGRDISWLGKTAGRGLESQKCSGSYLRWALSGRMPLQRRLPKRGFKSITLQFNAEALTDLNLLVRLKSTCSRLKQAGLVPHLARKSRSSKRVRSPVRYAQKHQCDGAKQTD
jgi:large subunit ribosomal protein L15